MARFRTTRRAAAHLEVVRGYPQKPAVGLNPSYAPSNKTDPLTTVSAETDFEARVVRPSYRQPALAGALTRTKDGYEENWRWQAFANKQILLASTGCGSSPVWHNYATFCKF